MYKVDVIGNMIDVGEPAPKGQEEEQVEDLKPTLEGNEGTHEQVEPQLDSSDETIQQDEARSVSVSR